MEIIGLNKTNIKDETRRPNHSRLSPKMLQ